MFDIGIIGAGPVGIFSVFQAGMMGLRCALIDALPMIGGQCSALYPEKPIYDIPGYAQISAQGLIDNLYKQARPFTPTLFLNQRVTALNKNSDDNFVIHTSSNNQITCNTTIIAAGCGAFGPNRPSIDNISDFENKSVFYSVTHRNLFINKRIIIAGGGDSAVDWALSISEIASQVYLIHRRNKFKAMPESINKLHKKIESGDIELITPYQLHNIHGKGGMLSSVDVIDLDNNILNIEADFLLPFFGLSTDLGEVKNFGLELVDNKRIKVDSKNMQTNLEGVFAVGDIAQYPGKLKLILTGFAEAALACHSAHTIINHGAETHFEYSTTTGVPIG